MAQNRVTLFFPGKKQSSVGKLLGHGTRLPLALLTLAPYIQQEGYQVRIVDNRLDKPLPDDFDEDVLVGITSKTGFEVGSALDFAEYVKAKNPAVPVVWGGVHASILPDVTLQSPAIDFVVRGPGENVIAQLLQAICGKLDYNQINGLSYKHSGAIMHTGLPRQVELNNLSLPAYDLIDPDEYYNLSRNFDYESS